MARRRNYAQATSSAFQIINQIMQQRHQDQIQKRNLAGQMIMEEARHGNDLNEREFGADQTIRSNSAQQELANEFKQGDESRAREVKLRAAPSNLMASVAQADTPQKLPSATGLANLAQQTEGIAQDKYFKDANFPVINGQEQVAYPQRPEGEAPSVVEQALKARQATEDRLKQLDLERRGGVVSDRPRVGIGPGGEAVTGTQNPLTKEFQQESLTGTQQGTQAANKEVAGNTPAAVRSRANAAGSVSYAESSNRELGTINTRVNHLEDLRKITDAMDSTQEGGAKAEAIRTSSGVLVEKANRMVELAQLINKTGGGWATVKQNLVRGGNALVHNDEQWKELVDLRNGIASVYLKILGRVGTPTENDEKRVRDLLPDAGLSDKESANRNRNFMGLVAGAQELRGALEAAGFPADINPNLPAVIQEDQISQRLKVLQGYLLSGKLDISPLIKK